MFDILELFGIYIYIHKFAVLGKQRGVRTISKTPMIWGMTGKCDTNVKGWEARAVGSFDTAVKGSSDLSAACLRNLMAEVAVLCGFISGGLFNDFIKFFDTIDIPILIDRAEKAGSPLPDLALILFMHTAPRVIQHATACSFPIQIFKSILAGCTFSVPLTRCLLRDDVEDIIYHNQGGTINTYIDDIPITLSERSRLRFKRNIIKVFSQNVFSKM